jgi:hypothetical protein
VATLVGAHTLVEETSAALTSPEAGPMFTSPEAVAAVGLADIGVMTDSITPATRPGTPIRTATGRNELKPAGCSENLFGDPRTSAWLRLSLTDDGRAIGVALRGHHKRKRCDAQVRVPSFLASVCGVRRDLGTTPPPDVATKCRDWQARF